MKGKKCPMCNTSTMHKVGISPASGRTCYTCSKCNFQNHNYGFKLKEVQDE